MKRAIAYIDGLNLYFERKALPSHFSQPQQRSDLYQVRELIVVTRPDHPGVFGFGHDGTSNLCSISLPDNGPVSLRVFELLQFTLVGQEQAHLRS
jgi:hypothetical protein